MQDNKKAKICPQNIDKITRQQQKSLHLFFGQLADELNREGKTMQMVLNRFIVDIPATKTTVKELIWKPLQNAMFEEESTTQLLKNQQIDQIYDVLNKFFSEEMEVKIPPFPNEEELYYEKLTSHKIK